MLACPYLVCFKMAWYISGIDLPLPYPIFGKSGVLFATARRRLRLSIIGARAPPPPSPFPKGSKEMSVTSRFLCCLMPLMASLTSACAL